MKNFSIAKSRRLRSTPYTSRIEKQGVTAYTIYNHMLLPAAFGSIEDSYKHLKEHVQVWDVAAERQVEISGKDSAELVQLMTCRDLSKSKIGRCYYCPIIDEDGNLVNDPVILKQQDHLPSFHFHLLLGNNNICQLLILINPYMSLIELI